MCTCGASGADNDADAFEKERRVSKYSILKPVSGEARLTHDCSPLPLRSKQKARFSLDVDLPSIPLSIHKKQYHQILAFINEVNRWSKRGRHRQGRPNASVKDRYVVRA